MIPPKGHLKVINYERIMSASVSMMINETKMSMNLSKRSLKTVESLASEMARQAIAECAALYDFSAEEAYARLGVDKVEVIHNKEKSAKKEAVVKMLKSQIPLPFSGVIREECCQGVKQNRGLYSQCENAKKKDSQLCGGCLKQASKNASGEPDCGEITKRFSDGEAWRDPKGRAPTTYKQVMNKLKLSEEQVLAEVARLNITFDATTHFAEAEKKGKEGKRGRPKKAIGGAVTSETDSDGGSQKKRGRPKKAGKTVEVDSTEDLFATLVQDAKSASPRAPATAAVEEMSDLSGSESDSESKKSVNKSVAKAEAKLEKAEAKALAKAEKEAAKALAKVAAKAEKAATKAEKKPKKGKKEAVLEPVLTVQTPELVAEEEEEEEEEVEETAAATVDKFEFKGKNYLKSSNNVLYDAETHDEVGVWSESKHDIEFCESDEESEEESEE